jgi:phage shock protein A
VTTLAEIRNETEIHATRAENRDTEGSQDKLSARLEALESAVSALKTRMEAAPSHQDLGRFHEKMNAISDKLSILIGKNEAFSETWRSFMGEIMDRGFGAKK